MNCFYFLFKPFFSWRIVSRWFFVLIFFFRFIIYIHIFLFLLVEYLHSLWQLFSLVLLVSASPWENWWMRLSFFFFFLYIKQSLNIKEKNSCWYPIPSSIVCYHLLCKSKICCRKSEKSKMSKMIIYALYFFNSSFLS